MNDSQKSDGVVVPKKSANKAVQAAAEPMEGRTPAKEHVEGQRSPRTQGRQGDGTALDRVRQVAKQDKKVKFTALLHHVTTDRLRAAFLAMNKDAAAGIDGVKWTEYGANLEANLKALLDRVHTGAYRAKASRRVYIPKADGRQRPLGIASLEDKLLQRAVAEVMQAIYEADFLGFSYGFRPGRSQHQALDALAYGLTKKKVNWVLDADIRGFFDAIDREQLIQFVEHRIGDKRVVGLLHKWLHAGVMEAGQLTESETGTAQGAAISPLLANVYLHYALDLWAQQWRMRHARGEMIIVRYADDFVIGFEYKADGERFHAELAERLAKFKLELHPDKTRLIEFGRFAASNRAERGQGRAEVFTFLGLTHICGQTQKGYFALQRHTAKTRLRTKLKAIREECVKRQHQPIAEQGKWLGAVVRGYFNYHAVPTNTSAISLFLHEIKRHWKRALSRRSQTGPITWRAIQKLAQRWLPAPRIQHPWPEQRFAMRLQGRSPVR
jgi:RNA-directed DNA polymerase